jgi:predicted O-linked N-acetylglucosamine transferase (SPINDLY family)
MTGRLLSCQARNVSWKSNVRVATVFKKDNFTAEVMRDTAKVFALRETNVGQGEMLPSLLPSQVPDQYDSDGERVRKLRVGYVSSDLQANHPVGRNVLGLLLAHDKNEVDVYCFSTQHVQDDPIPEAIAQTSTYVDLTKLYMSHAAIAKLIREEYKIDVLVDLNGWTRGRRLEIFAAKPAPVQITHGLGFVGTSGVDAFQYFISNAVATPQRFDHLYTEKVVRLPQAYLVASHKTVQLSGEGESVEYDPAKADKMALRKQEGLPEDKDIFVYCSFQSLNKISDEAFDTWMRILEKSPNSVLWFTSIKANVRYKLQKRAKEKFGVVTDRLVFGEVKQVPLHLVRAQACDLMLDSWPYNTHATATDILWAGVPLLVYLPDYHDPDVVVQVPKMASRVSASLLHTMELPHLIKSTIQEFEDEAVRLSHDREAYEAVRNDLIQKRNVSPLYDLKSYARYHEMAYIELFERFKRGEEPSELTLTAV